MSSIRFIFAIIACLVSVEATYAERVEVWAVVPHEIEVSVEVIAEAFKVPAIEASKVRVHILKTRLFTYDVADGFSASAFSKKYAYFTGSFFSEVEEYVIYCSGTKKYYLVQVEPKWKDRCRLAPMNSVNNGAVVVGGRLRETRYPVLLDIARLALRKTNAKTN